MHERQSVGRWSRLALVLAVVLAGGCGKSAPPRFHLNLQGRTPDFRDPDNPTREELDQYQGKLEFLVDALYAMFGEPDDPYVFAESGLDLAKIQMAAGPAGSDEMGQRRGLYRQHCAHCHGITGDGAGPTAAFLNPYPRDYRQGVFKFKSTERSARPTHADLKRVLVDGIPGTAMPSFALLPDAEIEALVEYVKYLSIRGQVESELMFYLFNEEELGWDRNELVTKALAPVVEMWQKADGQVIVPPDRPAVESAEQRAAVLAKGEELFKGPKAQCMKCHGPTALGDGSDEALFDDWNKDKTAANARLWLLPKQETKPRNLRLGIYRGGRSPADLYRRIHAGVSGSPMPQTGPAPGTPAVLAPEEIWALVDYVRSLPYEPMSQSQASLPTVERPRQ